MSSLKLPKSRTSKIFVLVVCLGFAAITETKAATSTPPNIIVLLVDDMGYADVGCMGARDIKTPNIDRIATEGVKMTDFYANAPVCSPTRAAFITGRWQQRCGIEWAIGLTSEEEKRVNGKLVPVAERFTMGLMPEDTFLVPLLKKHGYGTACYGKWHLGFKPEHNPVKHGFDEYWGIIGGQCDYYRYHYIDGMKQLYEKTEMTTAEGYITDLINQRTVRYIREESTQPFFIYVPYNAVHHPYQVPDDPTQFYTAENKNDGTRAGYAKMLESIDKGVGNIFAALEAKGILDNTLIIFTSDNGGERFSDTWPFSGRKTELLEGGTRVPLIVRWPGRVKAGSESAQQVISMDWLPTLLAAAGAAPSPSAPPDGVDITPALLGSTLAPRALFWRYRHLDQAACRLGDYKYLKINGNEFLFDVVRDPLERGNLRDRKPAVFADLKGRWNAWNAAMLPFDPESYSHGFHAKDAADRFGVD